MPPRERFSKDGCAHLGAALWLSGGAWLGAGTWHSTEGLGAPFMKPAHRRPGIPGRQLSLTQAPAGWREKQKSQLPDEALELPQRLKAQ